MPRTGYTKDGEIVLVEEDVPLPVTNINLEASLLNAVNEMVLQLKLLNARVEEAFETNITKEDI